jgi:hypothetical protein
LKLDDPFNKAHEHAGAATRALRGGILDRPDRQAKAADLAAAELKAALIELERVPRS